MTEKGFGGESGHRAEPSNIIDAIDRVRRKHGIETRGEHNRSLDWDNPDDRTLVREKFTDASGEAILPGFGPEGLGGNARDDCGNPHPFLCDNCGHTVEFGRTCSQSVCSRCGVAWVRDMAIKKAAKTRRIRREKEQNTPVNQKEHHLVISLPLTWYYDLAKNGVSLERAQEITKGVVKDVLDELRAQGMCVRHSFRGKNPDGTVSSEEGDLGAWKERLNSDRDFYGDVRDELAWMPHYHCVVVTDHLKVKSDGDGPAVSEQVEEATGWVLHRIEDDSGASLRTDGDMARALTYCLSHADIDVRNGHNRSAVWEVGSFQGDIIKSSSRFTAWDTDLEWADGVVRRLAKQLLGIRNGTSDCGAILPAVDDPDELARRILEELYPEDDEERDRVNTDAVLHHVSQGNIDVDVSTNSGGGGSVSVTSAWGQSIGPNGFGSSLPDARGAGSYSGGEPNGVRALPVEDEQPDDVDDDCECGGTHDHDHDDADLELRSTTSNDSGGRDEDENCDGKLIPLGEARNRGLLDDDDWCANAPHVDEAREADREWPDDLQPWRTSTPTKTIAIG